MAISHLARRASRLLQPLREIHQLNLVFDANVGNRNSHDIGSLRDSSNPFVGSKCGQPLSYGFIQRGSCDFDRMKDAVHVLNGHAAGSERHDGKISDSPFLRHQH
jgi:hypothetical protein